MDFDFDAIPAEEYERLQTRHAPLTQAVRDLIDAGIHTAADPDTLRDAQAAIEAVTARLRDTRRDGTRTVRHAETGRPVAWANPVVGLRNAIAPPLIVQHDADGRCWSEFDVGAAYEGPPGWLHGGMCALILDHLLGEAASDGMSKPFFTGTLTCRYRRGTPLGRLRAEARLDRVEGFKAFASGTLSDDDGVTVEAEGVFIMPAWAREQQ